MAGLTWRGDAVNRLIEAAGQRGVDEGIDIIGDLSQERVLVQTGELKRSRKTVRRGLTAAVGYTDSKAVGAHENLAVTPKKPGTRPKFLETAAIDSRGKVLDAIADQLRRAL
jgi:hypothetical protein